MDEKGKVPHDEYLQLKMKYDKIHQMLSERLYNLGDKFFEIIVKKLNETLDADYTFVGKLVENQLIEILALYGDGKYLNNFSFQLKNTPCENVVGKNICCYPKDVAFLFPQDSLLRDKGIVGYIGLPLFNTSKKPNGILVSMYKQPIEDVEFSQMRNNFV